MKKYLPYQDKAGLITAVADLCCIEQDGIIVYDYMKRELYLSVFVAEAYGEYKFELNDEGKYEDIESQFDTIMENGTYDEITRNADKDYFVLLEALDQEIKNRLAQNTVEHVLSKGIRNFIDMLDKRLDSKNLSKIVKQLEKLDFDKAKTVLEIVKSK